MAQPPSGNPDTIAAIATAPGRGGIGIVRVSGPLAESIAGAVIGRRLKPRHATLARFVDAQRSTLDEGIAIFYPAPQSYTGEHVVELQGHGGDAVLQLVLGRCLQAGARLAEPGEFSKRAFLNGKLDLAQAEAVADLIEASTAHAAKSAMRSLSGEFSAKVREMSEVMTSLRVMVEASLDFPEEDLELVRSHRVDQRLARLDSELELVLAHAKQGALLRSGIHIVLLGQTNVGKSSLLNRLAGEEVAIVTAVPGTTRDSLRSRVEIGGVPLHLVDTAGVRSTEDTVERIGIDRTWRAAGEADLAILVIDAAHGEGQGEQAIIEKLPAGLTLIRVLNKIDLIGAPASRTCSGDGERVSLSAMTGEGIDLLQQAILEHAGWQETGEHAIMARARHIDALMRAHTHVKSAAQQLSRLELIAEELRLAQQQLALITGEFTADDLLGEIFSRFCIGK